MKNHLEAVLILGCNGFTDPSGFQHCKGIENPIVDLTEIDEEDYDNVIQFFDDACGLFSGPVTDHNKCVNILSMLYRNYSCYDKDMLHNIQYFIKTHKQCGMSLMLVMKEDLHGG